MIVFTEELDFSNLTSDQVHHLAPKRSLGEFSWDIPIRPLPFIEYDLNGYQEAVRGFYQRLTLLRCAQNTRHAPTDAQIETFTKYLIDNQRDNPELYFGHGSWAIPEDTAMPSDAAIDFAFVPSYMAVAWLVLVKERYPRIARNVRGLEKALHRGLRFIFIKDLRGSGHDSNSELLKAVDYLSLGTVFSFIANNATRYSRLIEKVHTIESMIMGKLATARGFSTTNTYSRQKALQLIRGGDKDDSLVCPPVWHQWQLSQTSWAYNRVLEVAPSLAAKELFPSIEEKTVEIIQQLREAFISVKPEHAVFGQRRQVVSEPIELELDVSFDSSIEAAIGGVGVVPWVDQLSTQGFMKALNQPFINRLSHEINDRFNNAAEFNGEEFSIKVSMIKRHQAGYRLNIYARG